MVCGGFTCSKNALCSLNVVYMLVGLLLIGVAAWGKGFGIVSSIHIIGGVIAVGVFLLLISIVGLIGALNHHQVMLFFYMVILFLVFLFQFGVSCSCLAINKGQQVILGFITYSRVEQLDIRATSTHQHYDQEYDFPEADPLFGLPPRTIDWIPASDPKQRRRRRGRRSGLLVRLRIRAHRAPLPSILPANVQSLDSKVDEIQARVAFQRDIRDCNILCFTETWLTRDTLSESVQPAGFFTHRADRNNHLSGKKKGGDVCLMINETWCDHNNIQELKSFCSPDLEFLTFKCRPHYLPREFSSIIITVVYIPPPSRHIDGPEITSLDSM
uniref:Tetraspanin 31 n=1 Tax=Oncorhynchus tshawytscha TaxID=74940 RepID=A0AAZ3NQE4_ONCTS